MNHDDPLPNNHPYTLALGYLWFQGYADMHWVAGADALERPDPDSVQVRLLRHWRQEFFIYRDGGYRRLIDEDLVAAVGRFLNRTRAFDGNKNEARVRVTRGALQDVIAQLRIVCHVEAASMPVWLPPTPETTGLPRPAADAAIAFRNGLLDVTQIDHHPDADGLLPSAVHRGPTHEWFSEVVLPCDYDPDAACPQWERFLDQVFADDHKAVLLLQEFFGYCLTGDTSLEVMLWLHGESGGGKGTVLEVLQAVVGELNTVAFELSELGDPFALKPMMGARLAVAADAHLGSKTDADKLLGRLKEITGGGKHTVNVKGKEHIRNVRLGVRFVISTNTFPPLPDTADAMRRRLLFVGFPRAVANPNKRLKRLLVETELAGITAWAIRGLLRLRAAGNIFTVPDSSASLWAEFQAEQSPVFTFVAECCTATPYSPADPGRGEMERGAISCDSLFLAFKRWCRKNEFKATNSKQFGKFLRRAVPGLGRTHPRSEAGKQFYRYEGVALTVDAEQEYLNWPAARAANADTDEENK